MTITYKVHFKNIMVTVQSEKSSLQSLLIYPVPSFPIELTISSFGETWY